MRVYDPYVRQIRIRAGTFCSENLEEIVVWGDAMILAVNHGYFIKTLPNLLTEISCKKHLVNSRYKKHLSQPPSNIIYIKLKSGCDNHERDSWNTCL